MHAPRITTFAFVTLLIGCGHVTEHGTNQWPDELATDVHGASETDDADGDGAPSSATEQALSSPVHAVVENDCAPGGGPAVRIRLGLAAPRCDADPGATTMLLFLFERGPLAPATYELDDGGGFAFVQPAPPKGSKSGRVVITSWGEQVTGTYAVNLPDGTVSAGTFAGPLCPAAPSCG